MPSPFPGMDPFIEAQEWEDFHPAVNTAFRTQLAAQLPADLAARIEKRVVLEGGEDADRLPDVAVVERGDAAGQVASEAAEADGAPIAVLIETPVERHEYFIEIRDKQSRRLVTAIETLSQTNKRPGARSRQEYLRKRDSLPRSEASLVEIDLLRGGRPMPHGRQTALGQYRVIVSRAWERPKADVWAVPLLRRLPRVGVPLREGEAEVTLDVQDAVSRVYDEANYGGLLDYAADLDPPLPGDAAEVARSAV